jgi:hypothetical protein
MLHLSRVLIIILLLFCAKDSFSAYSIKIRNKDTSLIATRIDKHFTYRLGCYLSIQFGKSNEKISGQLYHVSNDSISLISKSKLGPIKKIAINDINSVTVLHKETRKNWLIIVSIFLTLTVIGLIYSTQGNLLALPFLILPVMSIYTYIPLLLFSFISDIFSKKSTKRSWSFRSISNSTPSPPIKKGLRF